MIRTLARSFTLCLALGALTGAALMPSAFAHGVAHHSVRRDKGMTNKQVVNYLLSIVNAERKARHLGKLVLSAKESKCSHRHSVIMAHRNSQFHDLKGDICIPFATAGENIDHDRSYAKAAVKFMNHQMMAEGPCPVACSPFKNVAIWAAHSHFLNLTSKLYHKIGIGVVYYKHYTWVTEDFTN